MIQRRTTVAILLCLTAVLGLLCRSAVTDAGARAAVAFPADEPYSLSYAAGGLDARENFLGGTVLMNLAAFGGKLYAGIGYWMDRPRLSPEHPDPPSGAQIVVLNSKSAQWQQEYAFNQRKEGGAFKYKRLTELAVVQFRRFDAAGKVLGPSAQLLVAGLGGPDGDIYTQTSPGSWDDTHFPVPYPIRSFTVHYDRSTHTDKLFAAGGVLAKEVDWDIFSGVYDPSAPGRIRWDQKPESIGPHARVMSMVECDGALFAAARPSIFRRDDDSKTWKAIYSYPIANSFDLTKFASGFRGLTCLTGPDGKQALLSGFEGVSGDVLRIDPQTGAAVVELHTREFLTQRWGTDPLKPDIIAGYNDIPVVKTGPNEVRLLGLLALNPNKLNSAWFLSRTAGNPPRYELHEVSPPPKWPHNRSDGALWSVVASIVSPFPEDHGGVLYLGGYDGHFKPDHNTAWLDRVGVDTALTPYKNPPR